MTGCNGNAQSKDKSVKTSKTSDKKEDSFSIKGKAASELIDLSKDDGKGENSSLFAQNQKYLDDIANEVRRTQPLVSDKKDMRVLVAMYNESSTFFSKAFELSRKYSHIRLIRGDGNCFYRSVLTAMLEMCLSNSIELTRIIEICKNWRQKLVDLGSPEFVVDDYCDSMNTLLGSIKSQEKTMETLMDELNVDSIANYYVAFMRAVCAGYVRLHPGEFSGFIEGERSLDQYCIEEIEPFWKECDHMCIVALVKAIGIPIRIEYMDQNQAPNRAFHHDFLAGAEEEPKLHLLYRPGHYDVLYLINKKSN